MSLLAKDTSSPRRMSQGIGIYPHLYRRAVQTGFYVDTVECWTSNSVVTNSIPIRVRYEDIFLRLLHS